MTIFQTLRMCVLLVIWGGAATAQTISLEADDAVDTTSTDAPTAQSETSAEAETAAQASNAPAVAATRVVPAHR